jgi:hypothetical protein
MRAAAPPLPAPLRASGGAGIHSPAIAIRIYTAGAERLALVPATGEVDYSAGIRPSGASPLSSGQAIDRAHAWLVSHALYPSGVDAKKAIITRVGSSIQVRFLPSTPFPVAAEMALPLLIVDLDSRGHILDAHRRWPALALEGQRPLLQPALAIKQATGGQPVRALTSHAQARPSGGTPTDAGNLALPDQTATIESVRLVYAPTGAGSAATLRPFYLLRGQLLSEPGGYLQPYTQLVPATAG